MKNILFVLLFLSISITLVIIRSCEIHKPKNVEKSATIATETAFNNELTETEISNGILTPEIMWKFGRVSESQLSPDGKYIVYGIRRYDVPTNKSKNELYIIPASGGEPKLISEKNGKAMNPRWKPDGSKIGYIKAVDGAMQIFETDIDGKNAVQISNIDGGINSFEYSPAETHILFTKDVKLEKETTEIYPDLPGAEVKLIDNLMYRHWDNWSDASYSHVFFAKLSGGLVTDPIDIMKDEKFDSPLSPDFDNAEISWSSDGKKIAYSCKKLYGKEYAVSTNSDIYLYDIETGATSNISSGMNGYDRNPVFSHNNKFIAWQSMATPGYESDKHRIIVYDIEKGTSSDITEKFEEGGTNIRWSEDDKHIYFISGTKATYQVYEANIDSKQFRQITNGTHDYHTISLQNKVLIGEKTSMAMANEIFSIDIISGKETQLSFTNKNIYDKIEMGKVEERWVKTTDNKEMLVWFIYPPKFDASKKYPAIMFCNGGPQSAVSQFFSFRWNFQMMAANGYVVVAPNRRGLPSFGREWNDQIALDYGGQNMKDYLSAIDYAANEPFVDKNKLGAVGPSYGGFSVFWLAGHHEKRFKAFIAHCGMFNLESQYGSTEEYFFVNHDLGGAYWEKQKPKSYSYSPHNFVQNWDTPILIITGGRDFRIPYTQSLEAFNAAQLRGIPSRLLFFPDETHFVVKPQNAILWQREFKGWLDKYLKN